MTHPTTPDDGRGRVGRLHPLALALLLGAVAPDGTRGADSPTETTPPAPREAEVTLAPPSQATPALRTQTLARGTLATQFPATWQSVKPRNRIIEHEWSVPGSAPSETPARLTAMAASGGVEQNLARWVAQFRPAEGEKLKAPAVDTREVAGLRVHTFDMSGTFVDSPRGPFGPQVEAPGSRMLGAIVETPHQGDYFLKLVGPAAVVDLHAEAFGKMLDSLSRVRDGAPTTGAKP